ncbi:MAG TPA: NnrS family protein [Terriglobales bacterium]|jgi:hypothetical protein
MTTDDQALNTAYAGTQRYERRLSGLLIAFLSTGLVYLLGPGSFLGLWNLFAISHRETAGAVSAAWLQAHAHAEIYGWVGSFILGIGFHSLTRLRHTRVPLGWAWTCWALWTTGVGLRWFTGVTAWHWRMAMPASAVLEVVAFAIFQRSISTTHRNQPGAQRERLPGWVLLVLTGAMGFLLTLVLNLGADFYLALTGSSPIYAPGFDHRLVELVTWAFLVPFIFGFSTRWLPVFAGWRAAPDWMPKALVACLALGVITTLAGVFAAAALAWLAAAVIAASGLHVFQPALQPAKTKGIHRSFPLFLRLAYAWLLIAALLGAWAAAEPGVAGIGGAGRHALTVGFIAGMVLTIGPRILPAFSGMKALYSPRLMLLALALLEAGCLLRVSGELLAYPGWWSFAWHWLPLSAAIEVTAFAVFAYNLIRTLLRPPAHVMRMAQQP